MNPAWRSASPPPPRTTGNASLATTRPETLDGLLETGNSDYRTLAALSWGPDVARGLTSIVTSMS
jgi:hypothetical protein